MKRPSILIALFFIVALPVRADTIDLTPPSADADESAWAQFGANLVVALKMDNDGVRISALHHVARYGERIDVRDAKFEMIRLFRNDKDRRVRLMALNALSKVQDAWVADFLYRSAHFETDPHMASMIYHAAVANERG